MLFSIGLGQRMKPWRLLVCNEPNDGPDFQMRPADLAAALGRAGHAVDIAPRFVDANAAGANAAGWAAALQASDALVGWRFPTRLIARHGAELRLIQSVNAGIDSLAPFDWLPPGAALCNASGIHAGKLREWAVMVLLMLHGRLPFFATEQRARRWSRVKTRRIAGHTVLVFGTGGLGGAVARAARSLGVRAIGVSRSGRPAADFDAVAGQDRATDCLGQADFVVLTLPLTPETRGLADTRFFAAMRPGAGFANFGRGALVDQPALCAALASGQLGGAVIDVTTPEPPPPGSPLWDAPNLIITPHVSCDDPTSYVADSLDLLITNLILLARGEPPLNQIDPAAGY
jgi:glyoxylate/hydroxypyruvate reductase A